MAPAGTDVGAATAPLAPEDDAVGEAGKARIKFRAVVDFVVVVVANVTVVAIVSVAVAVIVVITVVVAVVTGSVMGGSISIEIGVV